MVNLSKESREAVIGLAELRNKSISKTAEELIDFALEIYEDQYFSELADERMKNDTGEYLTHDEVWK